ncbi:MAG: hypothetical protein WDN24_05020 [Sphingomonas sp.]
MWDADPEDPELRQVALDWFARGPAAHPARHLVWEVLWGQQPGDPELRQAAIKWLRDPPKKTTSWHRPWRKLWQQDPLDQEIIELGLAWIRSAPEGNPSSGHVLASLEEARRYTVGTSTPAEPRAPEPPERRQPFWGRFAFLRR